MAWLFVTGSVLFGLGSFPPYFNTVQPLVTATTFFVGSLMFTSAAYVQYFLAINARNTERRWVRFTPVSGDDAAAGIQFVGTLFFTISTFAALAANLSVQHQNRLVWAPDVLGSAAFLVSSIVAYRVARDVGARRRGPWRRGWLIASDNFAGSVAFGISAIAALVLPTTGEVVNIHIVNQGTFIGAALFFAAGMLTLPRTET